MFFYFSFEVVRGVPSQLQMSKSLVAGVHGAVQRCQSSPGQSPEAPPRGQHTECFQQLSTRPDVTRVWPNKARPTVAERNHRHHGQDTSTPRWDASTPR